MIQAEAIISRVSAGKVWIKAASSSTCSACSQQAHCSTASLAQISAGKEMALDCSLTLAQGDSVWVEIEEGQLIRVALLVYLLPLIVLIVALTLATQWLPVADSWLPVLALGLLLTSFYLLHRLQWQLMVWMGTSPRIRPKA